MRNPYSVANMQEAFARLSAEEQATFNIRTTHQYVRFAPRNQQEYEELTNDSTLTLDNYPLDHEINGTDGGEYHDPSLPADQPTYQYAAVPAPYKGSGTIPFDVLTDLYLPEQDPKLDMSLAETQAHVSSLVNQAEGLDVGISSARVASYHPQGKLQVFDTRLNRLIFLVGVKVRVRRWFTYESAVTDENGDYYIARSFDRPVNYAVFYERDDFDIRSGMVGQAWYNGPKQSSPWNLDIMSGPHRLYAHINRAAADYYYRNRVGIKSPPRRAFLRAAMKIAAYDHAGTLGKHCKDCRLLGVVPVLYIHSANDIGPRFSDEIYGTTIHELAHASHWEFRRNNWHFSTEERLQESWAEGVEWIFTRLRYGSYGDRPDRTDAYQSRSLNDPHTLKYSPIAVDLFDDFDQSTTCFGAGCIIDPVGGFTFREMEDALHGANGFLQWRENLLAQPGHSVFRPRVEILFDNYL